MIIPETNKGKLIAAYIYCVLQIICWAIYINSNGNEPWFEPFQYTCLIVFFPLVILTLALGIIVWGSLNIFQANYVFGILIDFAVLSVVSIHIIILLIMIITKHITSRSTTEKIAN